MAGESVVGSKTLPGSEYQVVRATMGDRARIASFLTTTFYPYEPINVAIGQPFNPSEADMDHTLQHLQEGRSLLAMEGDRILGVAINGEITSDEKNIRARQLAECTCEDFKKFLSFWVYAEEAADFWDKDGPSKALDLEILAVDAKERGRGIGRTLLNHTRKLAQQEGYKLFRIDCSSYYAAKLAEMEGMTCVFSLPYVDYKNEDGEPVFKIPQPHTALKLFRQKLQD